MKETVVELWYNQLDWSMIWVCLGAIITLSFFIALNPNKESQTHGVGKYFINTWKNHVYNLFAGFVMLSFVGEVGFPILNYFMELPFEIAEGAIHFLSAISGLGGGYIIAKIIRLFQKLK